MSTPLSLNITEAEILIRFISDRDFKRSFIDPNQLIGKNIFFPYKGGVSLQRYAYCDENCCKNYAKKIKGRLFAGFFVFRKEDFIKIKKEYIANNRGDFEAELRATPLDVNNEERSMDETVMVEDSGNPTHADLIYINPAPRGNETPKIAIRSFSRKLAKVCHLVLDKEPNTDTFHGEKIRSLY